MPNASIIDIKLGIKSYDPNGSATKRSAEISKGNGSNVDLGMRVSGLKIKGATN